MWTASEVVNVHFSSAWMTTKAEGIEMSVKKIEKAANENCWQYLSMFQFESEQTMNKKKKKKWRKKRCATKS